MTRPGQVRQVGMAPLPDKRLQLWAVDEAGKLFTRTRKATSDPDASWEAWEGFEPPDPAKVRQVVGVAHLPNKRLQLWAVDKDGKLHTTYNGRDVPWVPWEDFKPSAPANVRQVEVAPLPDGRLQLWVVDKDGKLSSTRKRDPHDSDALWEEWKDF